MKHRLIQFSVNFNPVMQNGVMQDIKEELMKSLERMFQDLMMMEEISFERVRWELDYIVYPGIGSHIAGGRITKEEGREIFAFCEEKLKELKIALENR